MYENNVDSDTSEFLQNGLGMKNEWNVVTEFEKKIAEFFGLIDAYERIEELEDQVDRLESASERHENNLMKLHKDVQALKMEADILLKKSE